MTENTCPVCGEYTIDGICPDCGGSSGENTVHTGARRGRSRSSYTKTSASADTNPWSYNGSAFRSSSRTNTQRTESRSQDGERVEPYTYVSEISQPGGKMKVIKKHLWRFIIGIMNPVFGFIMAMVTYRPLDEDRNFVTKCLVGLACFEMFMIFFISFLITGKW